MDNLKQLFVDALLAYIEMREIHIDTKTVSTNVHSRTEEFYELLFDISHTIGERYVDLGNNLRDDHGDCPVQTEKIVGILTGLRDRLSSVLPELSKDSSMIGLDNLLRGHIDKLEFNIGNAKALEHKFKMKQEMGMGMGMKVEGSKEQPKEEAEIPGAIVVEIETPDEEKKESNVKDNNNGTVVDEVEQVLSI